MKRICSMILALVLMIACLPAYASAGETLDPNEPLPPTYKPTSGKAGENVTWTIHDDGTLVFSGWGPTDDNIQGITKAWCSYHSDSIKHIVFEEGITYIGS